MIGKFRGFLCFQSLISKSVILPGFRDFPGPVNTPTLDRQPPQKTYFLKILSLHFDSMGHAERRNFGMLFIKLGVIVYSINGKYSCIVSEANHFNRGRERWVTKFLKFLSTKTNDYRSSYYTINKKKWEFLQFLS